MFFTRLTNQAEVMPLVIPRLFPLPHRQRASDPAAGDVYLAEDTRLGRQVAIKVLPRPISTIPNAALNFLPKPEPHPPCGRRT
jgi:hypothetical protein